MSCSIVKLLMILFIQTILLLFSTPNIFATATSSSSLIKLACSNSSITLDTKLCFQIFQSDQKIVSATNLFNLSVAIIESGISNATNMRTYVENRLKKRTLEPNLKGVLGECKLSYDSVIGSLQSALGEVKDDQPDFETATYDLKIASTDDIERCGNAVASKRTKDRIILTGNIVLPIFGLSAFNVVEALIEQSPTSPAS